MSDGKEVDILKCEPLENHVNRTDDFLEFNI